MSDFKEIAEVFDLETWLESEGVPYKIGRGSSGLQLNIKVCPHCGDRRWRTYINADTGLGNCFICNEGFNKAKFVSQQMSLEGHQLGRYMREEVLTQGWKPKRRAQMSVEHGEIKLPPSYVLPTPDGQNLVYLEKRGITGEIARYFNMRWCDIGAWYFTEDGKFSQQNFNDRVIIPVYDLDGVLKTFQGRDITGTKDRKYLFPKTLPGTGRYLLNGQNALRSKRVIVGEGAMDCAAIKRAFDDVVDLRDVVPVGTFGKHLSYGDINGDDQLGRFLQLKAQGLLEVTIMWDGEWRAIIAALDAAKRLKGLGLAVKIAKLPKGRDPNEVLPEVVAEAFYKATPYSTAIDVRWRLRDPFA